MTTTCKICKQVFGGEETSVHGLENCVTETAKLLDGVVEFLDYPGESSLATRVQEAVERWAEENDYQTASDVEEAVESGGGINEDRCAEMIEEHLDDNVEDKLIELISSARSRRVRDAIGAKVRDEVEDFLASNDTTKLDEYIGAAIQRSLEPVIRRLEELEITLHGTP